MSSVSVVITTYNYGRYLVECLTSVIAQTYKDIEIIVVNDGSSDDTDAVIAEYIPKIIYIKQPNMGVVKARNNGALKATGDYLLFLDADDYLTPTYIAESVAVLDGNPEVSFVYGDRQVFGRKDYILPACPWSPQLLLLKNYIGLSSLMRREIFVQSGGFSSYVDKVKSYEDWDLWIKLSAVGCKGYYLAGLTYYYRRLDDVNRNKASVLQKLMLRWPLWWHYRWSYLQLSFLCRLPYILYVAAGQKVAVYFSHTAR